MAEPLEIEVKIRLGDAGEAREHILAAGGVEIRPRHFEDNRIFDNPDRTLTARGAILRIRATSDGGGRVTYKEKVRTELKAKVRREWEAEARPPETFARILTLAGFEAIFRYQKYRTVFRLGGCRVELDETPMGCFVEIEGPAEEIGATASRLGAGEAGFITEDYRALHLAWLEERGLPPTDMVFPGDPGHVEGRE